VSGKIEGEVANPPLKDAGVQVLGRLMRRLFMDVASTASKSATVDEGVFFQGGGHSLRAKRLQTGSGTHCP